MCVCSRTVVFVHTFASRRSPACTGAAEEIACAHVEYVSMRRRSFFTHHSSSLPTLPSHKMIETPESIIRCVGAKSSFSFKSISPFVHVVAEVASASFLYSLSDTSRAKTVLKAIWCTIRANHTELQDGSRSTTEEDILRNSPTKTVGAQKQFNHHRH